MFRFVTFVYPETMKLILTKCNPHFICRCLVLVKPYKKKGERSSDFRNNRQLRGTL
ncbi:Zinc finger C-x8-C-x5-C-x3-H type (and similar) [Musa troglodytarum]|uniref:Zinc finger C-x8-C-x5-C-x3-H type (And similar) n=1 Tax=Musa troglodytarum TaxID=320322 RepID=A0A9E7JND6_9LILI|nr:Zinc finger C-x8-C-x5-C-x3-H type (and similar) [Musa troglodytarum]